LCTTHKQEVNEELLAFIKAPAETHSRAPEETRSRVGDAVRENR
jgi:hypothetical protein